MRSSKTMKRTFAIAAALLFAVASAAFADLHGSWTADASESKPGRVQLNLSRGAGSHFGNGMDLADLRGLTAAQLASSATVPVQFQLAREAGTVTFEGTFRNGDGAGQWSFAPNRGYVAAVRALGVDFDLHSDGEEEDLLTVALLDVSTAYIRSM